MHLVAKTSQGLEEVLAGELEEMGARNIRIGRRAVEFKGNKKMMYRANFELRSALRIIVPIATFTAQNEDWLYREIRKINWGKYLSNDKTLAVNANVSSRIFTHSKYVALKTKDAIVDQFRDRTGKRPNVDVASPDLRIDIHVTGDQFTISLDSSGESLHKRGYRRETLEAPINEVLAAGIILRSGYRGKRTFIDPMCGAGTLLIEAYMIAAQIPPQAHRPSFGFQRWKDYQPQLWEEVKQDALKKKQDPEFPILGFDKNFQAINVCTRNLESVGLENYVDVKRKLFQKLVPPPGGGILVFNPPYDQRLQEENINELYKMIGDCLKKSFAGYEAWLISSNMPAIKSIGLRPSSRIPISNGPLDCRLVKIELYTGTRRKDKQDL